MESWKKAENDFKAAFSRLGKEAVVIRFSDAAEAKVLNGRRAKARAQASDFLVVVRGETFFAEVKSCEEKVSFPHSNIQPHQLTRSRQILLAGGRYYFFIKAEQFDVWYRVPASIVHNAERKSTRWTDIEGYSWDPTFPT
jgi:penicillin-binding protein-related factor A (putative recombinase)